MSMPLSKTKPLPDRKIDYTKSKAFWDARAKNIGGKDFLLATTLQDDLPAISDYRDLTEKKHLFNILSLDRRMHVLDLGGGTGRWAIELAKKAAKVMLVDFSYSLLNIGKRQAQRLGITNIDFIESSIQDFCCDQKFDLIILSGVLMYINQDDLDKVAKNINIMLKSGGRLVLREGISLNGTVSQIEEYAQELKSEYSVIWREPKEYIDKFGRFFTLEYTNDAFPYLIPVFFYKRLIPVMLKKNKFLQVMLKNLLFLQSFFDPFLLKCKFGMKLYHNWLKKQSLAVNAQFFIFRKDGDSVRHFYFSGKDVVAMAENKQTPFFVISQKKIRENYEDFYTNFPVSIKPRVYYSVKTNYESGVLLFLKKLGIGAEIGSDLDLFLARKAGFQPSDMVLDGLVKSKELLEDAVRTGIKTINIESFLELAEINKIAQEYGRVVNIGIRLDIRRRFGNWRNLFTDIHQKSFGIEIKECIANMTEFIKYQNLKITTLMNHTHKSFTTPNDYSFVLRKMFRLADFFRACGITIEEFNLGGGIPESSGGIQIIGEFAKAIGKIYEEQSKRYGFSPILSFELGKSLVGDTAILVGKVLDIKKDWVITDISRSDYGFSFPFRERELVVANKLNWPKEYIYRVCSSNLEKFDLIKKKKVSLPYISQGDTVVLFNTGAYSLPLATQFTRPRSAVYLLKENGQEVEIRQSETPEDVISKQIWENIL